MQITSKNSKEAQLAIFGIKNLCRLLQKRPRVVKRLHVSLDHIHKNQFEKCEKSLREIKSRIGDDVAIHRAFEHVLFLMGRLGHE